MLFIVMLRIPNQYRPLHSLAEVRLTYELVIYGW